MSERYLRVPPQDYFLILSYRQYSGRSPRLLPHIVLSTILRAQPKTTSSYCLIDNTQGAQRLGLVLFLKDFDLPPL